MGTDPHRMLATLVRRSLLNNLRISAWTFLTLATCAALVSLFTTVTAEVGRKLGHDLRALGANAVAYPAGSTADWARFEEIAERFDARTARLVLRVLVLEGNPVGLIAADPDRLAELTPYWRVEGRRLRAAGECLAGRRVAEALGWTLGQDVELAGERRGLVGIVETGDEDEERVFESGVARSSTGFHYALVSMPGGEVQVEEFQRELAAAGAGIANKPLRQVLYGEQHVLVKVNILFLITLAVVLVLTALGVTASMLARVAERRKELALLQAIGARKLAVTTFLLAESATVGVLGAGVGFVVGTGLAMVTVGIVFHVRIAPYWLAFVVACATTTVVALFAGGVACARTLQSLPATALRGE